MSLEAVEESYVYIVVVHESLLFLKELTFVNLVFIVHNIIILSSYVINGLLSTSWSAHWHKLTNPYIQV